MIILLGSVPILADSQLVGIDDNSDDNRADTKRYAAARTFRFWLTIYLQTRHFAAWGDTRRKTLITDLKSVQCGFESHRPY